VTARRSSPSAARALRIPRDCTRAVACASATAGARTRGFSLIIAMLMLAVIGLASAAIMRNATSGDQVANNNRLQTQANQYAQLALRFCELQLAQAPGDRKVPLLPAASKAAWTVKDNWMKAGSGSAHTLATPEIGSAVQPRVAPQCIMEATNVPNVYTLTARGFSADFRADAVTGATRSGSTVWLQATIFAESEDGAAGGSFAGATAATGPLSVRQRLWQQLLTPPF
jgi:type IV pilus assembly protein PilX